MLLCEFSEISWKNFVIENILTTALELSFVSPRNCIFVYNSLLSPRKKSEETSLVKYLQSCQI